jgi:DNA-binding MarR family transcriptional regulator
MEAGREKVRVAGECNCTALRKAARRVSLLYDRALAPSGLGVNQYAILAELDRQGAPLSLGALARAMVMDRSALGHNLRPLERDHLVVLGVAEEDRRSRAIAITVSGRRCLAAARRYWQQAQGRFQQAMGAERATALRALLAEVAAADYEDPS